MNKGSWVKLTPKTIGDVYVICPTCGHFLHLYESLVLFDVASVIETAIVDFICPHCTGGSVSLKSCWLFVPGINMFVHSNAFIKAPYREALEEMHRESVHCSCYGFTAGIALFSYGNSPLICGTCGSLVWTECMSKPMFYDTKQFHRLQGAQMKALAKVFDLTVVTCDGAFHKRKSTPKGEFINRFQRVHYYKDRPFLIGERPQTPEERLGLLFTEQDHLNKEPQTENH